MAVVLAVRYLVATAVNLDIVILKYGEMYVGRMKTKLTQMWYLAATDLIFQMLKFYLSVKQFIESKMDGWNANQVLVDGRA